MRFLRWARKGAAKIGREGLDAARGEAHLGGHEPGIRETPLRRADRLCRGAAYDRRLHAGGPRDRPALGQFGGRPHLPARGAGAAIVGGVGPAIAAAVLSTLAYNYFFTAPYHTLRITSATDIVTVV